MVNPSCQMDQRHQSPSENAGNDISHKNNKDKVLFFLFFATLLCTLIAQYFTTKSVTKIDLSKIVCHPTSENGPGYMCTIPRSGSKQTYSPQQKKRVMSGLRSFQAGVRHRVQHLPGHMSQSLTISTAHLYSKPVFMGVAMKEAQLMVSTAVTEAIDKLRLLLHQLMSSLGASKDVLAKLVGGLALFAQSVMRRSSEVVVSTGRRGGSEAPGGRLSVHGSGRGLRALSSVSFQPSGASEEMRRPRGIVGMLVSGDSSKATSGARSVGEASTVRHPTSKGGGLRRPGSALVDIIRGGGRVAGVAGVAGVTGVGMGSQW